MRCRLFLSFFFFKQKTAYEMRISDWSSDVCSSDLAGHFCLVAQALELFAQYGVRHGAQHGAGPIHRAVVPCAPPVVARDLACLLIDLIGITKPLGQSGQIGDRGVDRSEEHTSELQSLMRISYAVFCLKKKK